MDQNWFSFKACLIMLNMISIHTFFDQPISKSLSTSFNALFLYLFLVLQYRSKVGPWQRKCAFGIIRPICGEDVTSPECVGYALTTRESELRDPIGVAGLSLSVIGNAPCILHHY